MPSMLPTPPEYPNLASEPTPFAEPFIPATPARVDTAPDALTLRIVDPRLSETYALPDASTAMPVVPLNRPGMPSAVPGPPNVPATKYNPGLVLTATLESP